MRMPKEQSRGSGPKDDGGEVPIIVMGGQGTKATVEKRSFLARVTPNLPFSPLSRRRRHHSSTKARPRTSASSLKSISSNRTTSSGAGSTASVGSAVSVNNNISMARTAPDLTEEMIKEYREAFALFDLNGDGVITADELGVFITKMGKNNNRRKEDLKGMIAEVDADGDGAIDFAEFVTLMARKMNNVDKESEIREAFNVYDKDGSGKISEKELLSLMSKFHKDISENDIAQMIREADTNGDGEIEFEEFKRMLL